MDHKVKTLMRLQRKTRLFPPFLLQNWLALGDLFIIYIFLMIFLGDLFNGKFCEFYALIC